MAGLAACGCPGSGSEFCSWYIDKLKMTVGRDKYDLGLYCSREPFRGGWWCIDHLLYHLWISKSFQESTAEWSPAKNCLRAMHRDAKIYQDDPCWLRVTA